MCVGWNVCLVFFTEKADMDAKALPPVSGTDMLKRLLNRDPVYPGGNTAFTPEAGYRPENLQENFLGNILGIFGMLQQTQGSVIDTVTVLVHQFTEGLLVTLSEFGNDW